MLAFRSRERHGRKSPGLAQGVLPARSTRRNSAKKFSFSRGGSGLLIGSNPAAVISAMNPRLVRADVLEDEIAADARPAVELDHDQPAPEAERAVDRGERSLGLLQMVICVAQERQVDHSFRQIDRFLRSLDDLDLLQAALLRELGNVLEERG